jgi:PAS domain S-box-containing protein
MKNGLIGRETNRAAGIIDSSARIWIGTDMGASCYISRREPQIRPAPLVQLINLEASGTTFPLDRDIRLNSGQNDLTFNFRGISLIDEDAISYNLKLSNFDSQWTQHYKSSSNQIRYTNIPPGRYKFNLQAVNAFGIKSSTATSGYISIRKPFHRTFGFFALIGVLLVIIVLVISNIIARKRQTTQLEEQVKIRTKQLQESQDELRNIFDNAHDAILLINPDTEEIYEANSRACEIYGFNPGRFIGMSIRDISANPEEGKKKIIETLKSSNHTSFETVQYRGDGSPMYLEINASVTNYRGERVILSVNRDITPRKLAELKIKNSLKEKEILLKEIHHRVKNNLQIISSLLDLQLETTKDRETIDLLQDSKSRIHSMAMVHENLYQSKDLAQINIYDYVRDIVEYFFNIYGSSLSQVHYEIEIPELFILMDSAVPLGLILTELISNALKYAFPDDRDGRINISMTPEPPNHLTVIFSDNGIGLPPNLDIRQVETLGLQLVNLLTRQLNGNLTVDEKNGTSFKIIFPYRRHQEKEGG